MANQPLDEEAIFQAARLIEDGDARRQLLDRACEGNPALRERLGALLAEQEKLGSYLEVPAEAVATIERPVSERIGMQIGPYKLLQKLGEGGMGSVYLAEQQQPVKRHVALKIIKAGMDSAQVIARFEAERQALAIMDHPHIAKVLDAGTTDSGRPYFVMELVKGIPITRYCDQEHLSPKERLELFIPVCQAVQHAHQKGIIHRDLKPSNVMIALYDGRPVPKVIDFGVAKATSQKLTERTLFTEVGSIVGTLEYMAPEQAELNNLDIDTRADIYSLGVLLYELLTGATPFSTQQLRGAGFNEMLRIIKEVEPQKPSTKLSSSAELPSIAANRKLEPARLTKVVRGDLDWIVMKCLEKERGRRYETANAFALDIQRYLHDEPVLAGPPSNTYRLKKFLRRNKGPAAAAAVLLLTLSGGVVGTTWGLIRAEQSRRAEAEQRKLAEAAETLARTNEQQATAERNRAVEAQVEANSERTKALEEKQRADGEAALAKGVNDFLQNDLLGQADLYTRDMHALPPDRDVKLHTILDRAAASVGERFSKQPLVESAVRLTIGQAYFSLGEYHEARKHLQRAMEIRREQLGEDHLDTLVAANALAMLCAWDGQFAQGEDLFNKVVAGRRMLLGNEHPDTLTAMWALGELYSHSGKHTQQEALVTEVLAGRRKVLGEEHPDTLACKMCAAMLQAMKRRFDVAEPALLKVLEGQRKALGEKHPSTLMTTGNLGWVYLAARRFEDAERVLSQNLENERQALGSDHPLTLGTLHNLAGVYKDLQKFAESERCYLESINGGRKIWRSDHELMRKNLQQLARLYQDLGKDEQAEPLLVELHTALLKAGANPTAAAAVAIDLADNHIRRNKLVEAETLLRESLSTLEQKSPTFWMRFYAQNLLGGVLLQQKKFEDAEPLLVEGYEGMKRRETMIPESQRAPRLSESLQRLVQLYESLGKKGEAQFAAALADQRISGEAETWIMSTLNKEGGTPGAGELVKLAVMRQLAPQLRTAGRLPDEISVREVLLKADQARWGRDDNRTLTTMHDLAWAYWYGGKYTESERTFAQVREQRTAKLGADHADTLSAANGLAWSYQRLRRLDAAIELFEHVRDRLEAKFGPNYSSLLSTLSGLTQSYEAARQMPKAIEARKAYINMQRQQYGATDARVADSLAVLGKNLIAEAQFADAEPIVRECLAIREKAAPNDWQVFNAKSMLGNALAGQKKFTEAEPLLLQGYEGMKEREAQVPESFRTRRLTEALQRLIDLYTAWEKPDEVAKWRSQLDDATSSPSEIEN